MGLGAQLGGALDCSALATQFLGNLAGPSAELDAVTAPVPGGRLDAVAAGTGGIDRGPLADTVGRIAEQARPLLTALPGASDLLGPLESAIAAIEALAAQDITARFDAVVEAVRRETQAPLEGGHLALVLRLVDVLNGLPEAGLLRGLVAPLIARAQLGAATSFPLLDIVRGGDATVRTLGGMMCLATVLAEAERLAATMAAHLDATAFAEALRAVDGALTRGDGPLASFVAGVDASDEAQADAALNALGELALRLDAARDSVAAALGLGEATLVYLDIDRLQAEVDTARAWVRGADLDPLGRVLTQAGALINPLLRLDLGATPAQGLSALIARIEAEIGAIAATVAALDPAIFVAPLADGIRTLTQPIAALEAVVTQVTQTLRAALATLRDAVAALPVDDVANALRAVLDPIAAVLRAVTDLLDEIEDALDLVAGNTSLALRSIDAALDAFQQELDTLFGAAREVLADADIDAAVGTVAQNIQAFAQLLERAQMKPYFDTAVGAIGAATDVVEAVPFGLLPESMKADVDAAVKPIKDTDVTAVERDIEAALGIGEDGTFSLRQDIEAAVDELQTKYQALLDVIDENDPRILLAEVDQRLDELAERVRTLAPDLTLQPVQDAVDELKRIVAGIDLDALLAPVRAVFDEIDATLDRYAPSVLVQPLQARLDTARTALIDAIQLDTWDTTLDTLQTDAVALLARADPARLQPLLQAAMQEALDLLAQFPTLQTGTGLGTIVAGLLSATGLRLQASSFPEVRGWLGGRSGAAELAARTDRFARSLITAKAVAAALDVQAQTAPLLPRLGALQAAAQALLTRLADDSPQRVRLQAVLPRLDAAATFGTLAANRARYVTLLDRAAGLAEGLRRTGFSEVDTKAAALRAALTPLAPAGRTLQGLFAKIGISPDEIGVVGIARVFLAAAPPERLAGLGMPVFAALRGRLQALLAALLGPVQGAIGELRGLIDAIDLAPLAADADAVVAEVKQQIGLLHPDRLLAEPLQAFAELRTAIVDQDPLLRVTQILTDLRELIAAVLEKLSLERLLAVPLAVYDEVLEALHRIDPDALLQPVLDQLDAIALQVDTGLDDTVVAFQRLQAALPSGGGGSSGSLQVGIG